MPVQAFQQQVRVQRPRPTFIRADFREYVHTIEKFDVLFYRRDSDGEGGSGVYILGDQWLRVLLPKLNPEGGLIITDGSNSRGSAFKRMRRNSGLRAYGRHVYRTETQPYLETEGLYRFEVSHESSPPMETSRSAA